MPESSGTGRLPVESGPRRRVHIGGVARDGDTEPGGVEWLDVVESGGPNDSGPSRQRWRRWSLLFGAGVLVTAAVLSGGRHGKVGPTAPAPSTTGAQSPTGVPPSPLATAAPAPTAPVVRSVGRSLLGVTAHWELFGRGPDAVVRIQLAAGRITRTPMPALLSSGPMSFVVCPDRVIIRPLDAVPGYAVVDGRPARGLRGALSHDGPALPGPNGSVVWVGTNDADPVSMTLTSVDGKPTGVSVRSPRGVELATADGAGYLVVPDVGGVYDARPDGLRRITTGELLAVGPTRWLTTECDDRHRCATVVIDRRSGARRVLGPPLGGVDAPHGVIAPDGSRAALLRGGPDGTPTVHLLDLGSGTDRRLAVDMSDDYPSGSLVWSPDSRWLFVAAAHGRVSVVDPRTGRARDLGVALPQIVQLGIRDRG